MLRQAERALLKIDIALRIEPAYPVASHVHAGDLRTDKRRKLLPVQHRRHDDYAVDVAGFHRLEIVQLPLRVAVRMAENDRIPLVARHRFYAGNQLLIQPHLNARHEQRNRIRPPQIQPPRKPVGRIVLRLHHRQHVLPRFGQHLLRVVQDAGYGGNRYACRLRNLLDIQREPPVLAVQCGTYYNMKRQPAATAFAVRPTPAGFDRFRKRFQHFAANLPPCNPSPVGPG